MIDDPFSIQWDLPAERRKKRPSPHTSPRNRTMIRPSATITTLPMISPARSMKLMRRSASALLPAASRGTRRAQTRERVRRLRARRKQAKA
jgi:hypothetical protein